MESSKSVSLVSQISVHCNNVSLSSTRLWHYRLGHPPYVKLNMMSNELRISSDFEPSNHCSICPLAKQIRLPFISSNHLSSEPFNLIHLDIWGPFHTMFIEGFQYFLTIVDDYTRFTWVYFLCAKSDFFFLLILTQFGAKIKSVRSDNAPELTFTDFYRTHRILLLSVNTNIF